ncbi:hypothetical protein NKJ40_19355 [Mesorhizobium sp. M0119]|uniref:hypothetical protein n=1 Tax=unclassified Mesorhizobium TaxID=325217 RepID=UPI0033394274
MRDPSLALKTGNSTAAHRQGARHIARSQPGTANGFQGSGDLEVLAPDVTGERANVELAIEFCRRECSSGTPLETIDGLAADARKVFNGSSRSRIEVERSSSGGRTAELAISKSNGKSLFPCAFCCHSIYATSKTQTFLLPDLSVHRIVPT